MSTSQHHRARARRVALLSATAALFGGAAFAQQPPQADTQVEEVVITGSRITGFAAPTPLTVIGADELQRVAPLQVSEALTQMPQFRATGTSSSAATYANLRAIGQQRTLLLVDGRRHVPTFSDGTVDLSLIPTAMISRTEVVTGGASASWGSDAVAGVVNLVFDDKLQGFKGVVQGGASKYGDAENYSASVAYGTRYFNDRGYLLIGAEYAFDDGIRGLQPPNISRPWAGRGFIGNVNFAGASGPGAGMPGRLYDEDTRRADVSDGGLITYGPLRGINFLGGGATSQFGFGFVPATATAFATGMIGGTDNYADVATPGGDARYPLERYSFVVHSKFDVTDSFQVFGEAAYEHSLSAGYTNPIRNNGAVSGAQPTCTATVLASALGSINVNINNPFLPGSVVTAMQNRNITCFSMGRTFRDDSMGEMRFNDGSPFVTRVVLGYDAALPWGDWTTDGYVQYGAARYQNRRIGNMNVAKFRNAIDAVRVGSNNVCRINADVSTTNDDPACVAVDLFGPNSVTPAMAAYFTGTAALNSDTYQTVASLNADGELLQGWAGPIKAATGVEYRKEHIFTKVDAISQASGWQTGNRKDIAGEYDVREVYGELAIPLAADQPRLKDVSLNLAGRYTDYSSSGGVTTWKAGLNWSFNDQLRLRATQSRDIRAGNLGELFTATSTTTTNVQDPRNAAVLPALITTTGNPDLSPEEADTFTAGLVWSPAFAPKLRLSADYYSIDIAGVIATIQPQQVVDRCYRDNIPEFCAQVTTNAAGSVITGVQVGFENLDSLETAGWDFEAAYSFEAAPLPGQFSTRLLASYVKELATTVSSNATTTNPAGQYTNPHWTVFGDLSWGNGPWDVATEVRWFQGGTIDNTRIYAAKTAIGSNINSTSSTYYTNLTVQYALPSDGDHEYELFARINNLFNRAPPFPSVGGGIFDEIGRAYRVGVRFRY